MDRARRKYVPDAEDIINVPAHVGIIMDGNGRWATKRGLPRTAGHLAGAERLHALVQLASDIGIEAITLYAFSSENWKRPKEEVDYLCRLFLKYLQKEINELDANDVCLRILGDTSAFPSEVEQAMKAGMQRTASNKGLKLNLALNYGGQDEILRAARLLAADAKKGTLDPKEITSQKFEEYLYTAGMPALDLLIRTGGEKRLSNFLLYQSAYAELLFLDDYWPDFTNEKFLDTLRAFQKRTRRFGGL